MFKKDSLFVFLLEAIFPIEIERCVLDKRLDIKVNLD